MVAISATTSFFASSTVLEKKLHQRPSCVSVVPCRLRECKRNSKSKSQKLIAYKSPIEKFIARQEEASNIKKRQQELQERTQKIYGQGFDQRQLCIMSTPASQVQRTKSPSPTKADLRAVQELSHWKPSQVVILAHRYRRTHTHAQSIQEQLG